MVRVAIVGLSHWYAARAAAAEITNDPRASLQVMAHGDPVLLQLAQAECGAQATTSDLTEAVRRPDVDLVVTACTTRDNPALVRAALEAGKPVVSVKPLAMTVADAEGLADLAASTGRLLFPLESQARLSGAHRTLQHLLRDGRLGQPLSAMNVLRGTVPTSEWPGREVRSTWWVDPDQVPGGGWIDHAIYRVDLLRWLLGAEVTRVYAETTRRKHPELRVEDFGTATLRFDNGVVATLEVTWAGTAGAWINTFHLVGTDGQVILDDPFAREAMAAGPHFGAGWTPLAMTEASQGAIGHVLDVLEGRTEAVADARDARANLAVCLAAYESARTHQVVALPTPAQ